MIRNSCNDPFFIFADAYVQFYSYAILENYENKGKRSIHMRFLSIKPQGENKENMCVISQLYL